MKIGEKLQALITEKGTNANELAQRANVPTSTMYSIIKRNNTKADIDVLIRIANILGVPVEYFGEEQSVWSTVDVSINATDKAINLTNQEILIIKKYRQLDADGKNRVDYVLNMEFDLMNNSAEKEEESLG